MCAVAGLGLLLTGCTTMVSGTAQPADHDGPIKPKPISTSAMAGKLLDTSEVADIVKTNGTLVQRSTSSTMGDTGAVAKKECRASWSPMQEAAYNGSGWSDALANTYDDAPDADTRPENGSPTPTPPTRSSPRRSPCGRSARTSRWCTTVTPSGSGATAR
jgi:hypothetical protein